jgi:hypothetical protein
LYSPVVIFGYNRPEKFLAAVSSLSRNQLAKLTELFVFIDGPKTIHDIPLVNAVNEMAQKISGFKDIRIISHSTNLGLANSIKHGLSFVLKNNHSVIVIEDDLIVSDYFLDYMNSGLRHYANEPRVASIQGYQYPVAEIFHEPIALKGADCWGWATWRDRWESVVFDSDQLYKNLKSRGLDYEFDLDESMHYMIMLENERDKLIDSWAICWHASMFLQDRVSIYPGQTLVINTGFDGKGTHKTRTKMFDTKLGYWNVETEWPEPIENSNYRVSLIDFYKNKHHSKDKLSFRLKKLIVPMVEKLNLYSDKETI